MAFSLNKSSSEDNRISRKMYYNSQLPDFSAGLGVDLDNALRIVLPPDDTFGYNFIKISTYCSEFTQYKMNIYAVPPAKPPKEGGFNFGSNGGGSGFGLTEGYRDGDTPAKNYTQINTGTPYFTEDLTGNQYHYRVLPIMGEYTYIEFIFNFAFAGDRGAGDKPGHLYCKTMLSRDTCNLITQDTFNH